MRESTDKNIYRFEGLNEIRMIQKEVTDSNGTRWVCVQAFSDTYEELAKKAAEIANEDGKMAVVCTPSGGAQTVRLQLNVNWENELDEEQLVKAIQRAGA